MLHVELACHPGPRAGPRRAGTRPPQNLAAPCAVSAQLVSHPVVTTFATHHLSAQPTDLLRHRGLDAKSPRSTGA
ncbi:hypothetical protein THIX_20546 [Thiomonas sp. X19]|nr:hypothetical protein THIX_20546 [Thiomonas sp. X19]